MPKPTKGRRYVIVILGNNWNGENPIPATFLYKKGDQYWFNWEDNGVDAFEYLHNIKIFKSNQRKEAEEYAEQNKIEEEI